LTVSRQAEQDSPIRLTHHDELPPDPRRRGLWIALIAVAVLVVAALASWGIFESDQPDPVAAPAGATNLGGPNSGLVAAGTGPVQVELYLGFPCPACQQYEQAAAPTLDALVAAHKITLIWHPLGRPDASSKPAGYSDQAAASTGCAADRGLLKPYGDALLAAQPAAGSPGLSDDQLVDLAGQVGIINPAFAACVRSGKYQGWVTQADQAARQRGVSTAPAVWIQGRSLGQPTEGAIMAAVTAAGG
jgi:protein-disulfide isomerase